MPYTKNKCKYNKNEIISPWLLHFIVRQCNLELNHNINRPWVGSTMVTLGWGQALVNK